jgi:hypothetical protein
MTTFSQHTLELLPRISSMRSGFRAITVATLLAIGCGTVNAVGQGTQRHSCFPANKYTATLELSGPSDTGLVRAYEETAARLLTHKKYDELDCLAERFRSKKEQLPEGRWKLDVIYSGLASPVISPVHATEEDWKLYLRELRKWPLARPKSITARVALAEAMTSYAWYARGNGMGNTVSASGWKLFGEYMAEAKRILDAASDLPVKCPEWYAVMQDIALAQGWSDDDRRALFDQAVKFEPEYYQYYRGYATTILPKWGGEVGAAAKFLQEASDRVGGDSGDILYFQTAARMTCGCNEDQELGFSWPRIQRGFEALKKRHGTSFEAFNLLARAAIKNREAMVADRLFARIGDQWSEEVWQSRQRFESSRKWASQWSPSVTPLSKTESDDGNTKYDSDVTFRTAWKERIAVWTQKCLRENHGDAKQFDLYLGFTPNGTLKQTFATNSDEPAACVLRELSERKADKLPLIEASPDHPPRGIRLEIDPADFTSVASKK